MTVSVRHWPASTLDPRSVPDSDSPSPSRDVVEEQWIQVVSEAVGEELRCARKARGWSRSQLAERLPSRIGDRTLASYEHGTRHLTVVRMIEVCQALGVDSCSLQRRALQRARINLAHLTLQIDLHALLNDQSNISRPMARWARNVLSHNPDGIVEIEPVVVRHLALFIGCTDRDLANHLARFIPETEEL